MALADDLLRYQELSAITKPLSEAGGSFAVGDPRLQELRDLKLQLEPLYNQGLLGTDRSGLYVAPGTPGASYAIAGLQPTAQTIVEPRVFYSEPLTNEPAAPTARTAGAVAGTSPTPTGEPLTGGTVSPLATTLAGAPAGTTTSLIDQLIQQAIAIGRGEPAGLSSAARSALTTQALEEVPQRFAQQGRDLATSLLRRGGGLPAGGEFLQSYGPFVAAQEATRSGLLRDVTLADEETRQRNRELNLQAQLQGLGTAAQLAGQRGQLELGQADQAARLQIAQLDASTRLQLGDLDATTRLSLGQLDADTRLELQKMDSGTRMALADLDSQTRLRLEEMGITSDYDLAILNRDLSRELTALKIDADAAMNLLDNETRIKVAELQTKGGDWGKVLAASLISSVVGGEAGQELIGRGIDWVMDKLFGTAATAGAAGTAAATTGTAAGGFGSSIGAFIGIGGIGAALAIGGAILKSQAHWEANEAVQQFENPFANTFLVPFHDKFFAAAEAGALTKEQARLAIQELRAAWQEYQDVLNAWAKGSSDKELVAFQSINGVEGMTAGAAKQGSLRDTIDRALANMETVFNSL